MTLAGLEEAEMLVAPDLGSDAMVVAAVTATYSSSGAKFNPPWGSSLTPCGAFGVRGAAGHSRYFFGFHGSRVRSGGQNGHMIPYPQRTSSALGKPYLRWLDSSSLSCSLLE